MINNTTPLRAFCARIVLALIINLIGVHLAIKTGLGAPGEPTTLSLVIAAAAVSACTVMMFSAYRRFKQARTQSG